MELPFDLAQMDAQALRDLAASLIQKVTQQSQELQFKQLKIDQLTHEMATLKRWRFGRRSEQLDPVQRSLLEESIDEDLSEKLDYTPGILHVERHVRGKWVCRRCEKLIQAPVPPQVIDKGI